MSWRYCNFIFFFSFLLSLPSQLHSSILKPSDTTFHHSHNSSCIVHVSPCLIRRTNPHSSPLPHFTPLAPSFHISRPERLRTWFHRTAIHCKGTVANHCRSLRRSPCHIHFFPCLLRQILRIHQDCDRVARVSNPNAKSCPRVASAFSTFSPVEAPVRPCRNCIKIHHPNSYGADLNLLVTAILVTNGTYEPPLNSRQPHGSSCG